MTSQGGKVLHCGIICSGTMLCKWQALCIEKMLKANVVISLLIITPPLSKKKVTVLNFLFHICEKYIQKRAKSLQRVDVSSILSEVPQIHCHLLKNEQFSKLDLETIINYNLDFILHFGVKTKGEILDIPSYGVWSFDHVFREEYRGGPPGFWEIYNGDKIMGAILQRHSSETENESIVLQKGVFLSINHSYIKNKDKVLLSSADLLIRICKDILNGNASHKGISLSQNHKSKYNEPGNFQLLIFILKLAYNFLARLFKILFICDKWNVGVINQPIHTFLVEGVRPEVSWLPQIDDSCYIADPFVLNNNESEYVILVEEFDYRTEQGFISALSVDSNNWKIAKWNKSVISLPVHMSYPCLIEHKEEIYCIPETYQTREVALFKAIEFPRKWEKVCTLIKDFAAVDSTVFEYNGCWWLFCTDRDSDQQSNLYIWYASALSGPWQQHAANPVKNDVRSSRPGGTPFMHEGQLYRPAQDSSKTYGGRIAINKITKLSKTDFCEELVVYIEPFQDSPYPDGLHTLSAAGEITVIDSKRFVFIPYRFARVLKSITNKLIAKVIPR